MSTGKASAQASHAAVEAYRLSCPPPPQLSEKERLRSESSELVQEWYKGGHYMKLIMEARDEAHLHTIERYLNDRGFKTALIIDEGRTEIPALTATALGVELVDKDDPHTAATFSSFQLFKEPKVEDPQPRIPETDEFDRVWNPHAKDEYTPEEPWWIKRYRNNPAKISADIELAGELLRKVKKP